MDTTRKLPEEDILVLDSLQLHLRQKGIKVSQKALITQSIKFASEHEREIQKRLHNKGKDNTQANTERLLRVIQPVKLGKNWLEEIDTTL